MLKRSWFQSLTGKETVSFGFENDHDFGGFRIQSIMTPGKLSTLVDYRRFRREVRK